MRRCPNGHSGVFFVVKRAYVPPVVIIDAGDGTDPKPYTLTRITEPLATALETTYRCETCGATFVEKGARSFPVTRTH